VFLSEEEVDQRRGKVCLMTGLMAITMKKKMKRKKCPWAASTLGCCIYL
jgi:hypothetical protein